MIDVYVNVNSRRSELIPEFALASVAGDFDRGLVVIGEGYDLKRSLSVGFKYCLIFECVAKHPN